MLPIFLLLARMFLQRMGSLNRADSWALLLPLQGLRWADVLLLPQFLQGAGLRWGWDLALGLSTLQLSERAEVLGTLSAQSSEVY